MSAAQESLVIAQLNEAIVGKALAEPAFRAKLIANPNAAVEQALQTSLPPGVKLKVVEATQQEFTIVLPYELKTSADGEMTDDDLEAVAGGSKAAVNSMVHAAGNYLEHTGTHIGTSLQRLPAVGERTFKNGKLF